MIKNRIHTMLKKNQRNVKGWLRIFIYFRWKIMNSSFSNRMSSKSHQVNNIYTYICMYTYICIYVCMYTYIKVSTVATSIV